MSGLPPVGAADEHSPQQFVRQLGADDFIVRQRAEEKLAELGAEAFDLVAAAESDPDVEVAARVARLLRVILSRAPAVEFATSKDTEHVQALLKHYDQQNESARRRTIGRLARLPDDAGLPALCRLVRYESAARLSRFAAAEILRKPVAARCGLAAARASDSPKPGAQPTRWRFVAAGRLGCPAATSSPGCPEMVRVGRGGAGIAADSRGPFRISDSADPRAAAV